MLLVLCTGSTPAIEPIDSRGLDVIVADIGGSVELEGVAARIQQASGRDVPALVERIEQRWRREGSTLHRLTQSGWQISSRLLSGNSEIIQWRGHGVDAVLLHSVLDTHVSHRQAPDSPPALARSCAWSGGISGQLGGQAYQQRTAICTEAVPVLLDVLRSALARQGWEIRRNTEDFIEVALRGRVAGIHVRPGTSPATSTVVWTEAVARMPGGP
jgi:hypothetical protein